MLQVSENRPFHFCFNTGNREVISSKPFKGRGDKAISFPILTQAAGSKPVAHVLSAASKGEEKAKEKKKQAEQQRTVKILWKRSRNVELIPTA